MGWLSQIWIAPAIGTLLILRLWAAAAPAACLAAFASQARRRRGC
jgi:hypothetical protein